MPDKMLTAQIGRSPRFCALIWRRATIATDARTNEYILCWKLHELKKPLYRQSRSRNGSAICVKYNDGEISNEQSTKNGIPARHN